MIESNTIYNEDCLETMKRMPNNFVDLIVTDPPYGMDYSRHIVNKRHSKIANDRDLKWVEPVFRELMRVLKPAGHIYSFSSWHKVDVFKQTIEQLFHLKNVLVWDKGGSGMGDLATDFGGIYELIIMATKRSELQKKLNGSRDSNILRFGRSGNEHHPTQKPLKLINYLVQKSSDTNDIVYDPFMGSGTTARACKDLGRNYIGSEISKEYCDIAEQRLRQGVLL